MDEKTRAVIAAVFETTASMFEIASTGPDDDAEMAEMLVKHIASYNEQAIFYIGASCDRRIEALW